MINFKLKNIRQLGFSLIEVLIGIGVLSAVSLVAASIFVSMNNQQKRIEVKSDQWTFVQYLRDRWLYNPLTCKLSFGSGLVTLPATPTPIVIGGLDYATLTSIAAGTYLIGDVTTPRLRISRLEIMKKLGVPSIVVRSDNLNYNSAVAIIRIGFEQFTNGAPMPLQDTILEIPVLVDAADRIQHCRVGLTGQDVCAMVGANYDGPTSECVPQSQCQVQGTYAVSTCTPAYIGCSPGTVNNVTGALSCPSGASATKTGETLSVFDVSCGKKCSQTIQNKIEFFLCTRCS